LEVRCVFVPRVVGRPVGGPATYLLHLIRSLTFAAPAREASLRPLPVPDRPLRLTRLGERVALAAGIIAAVTRHLGDDARPLARLRLNGQASAHTGGALSHDAQPEPRPLDLVRVETAPVVLDRNTQHLVAVLKPDGDARSLRVAAHVGHGLLNDADQLDLGGGAGEATVVLAPAEQHL